MMWPFGGCIEVAGTLAASDEIKRRKTLEVGMILIGCPA